MFPMFKRIRRKCVNKLKADQICILELYRYYCAQDSRQYYIQETSVLQQISVISTYPYSFPESIQLERQKMYAQHYAIEAPIPND